MGRSARYGIVGSVGHSIRVTTLNSIDFHINMAWVISRNFIKFEVFGIWFLCLDTHCLDRNCCWTTIDKVFTPDLHLNGWSARMMYHCCDLSAYGAHHVFSFSTTVTPNRDDGGDHHHSRTVADCFSRDMMTCWLVTVTGCCR